MSADRAGQRPSAEGGGGDGGTQTSHRREEHAVTLKGATRRALPRRPLREPGRSRSSGAGDSDLEPVGDGVGGARGGGSPRCGGGGRKSHQTFFTAPGPAGGPARRVGPHVVVP